MLEGGGLTKEGAIHARGWGANKGGCHPRSLWEIMMRAAVGKAHSGETAVLGVTSALQWSRQSHMLTKLD